jgi:4,5-DOPA dioxygenase extradiol
MRMPVLFIGHGSPMNIVADNDFTRRLVKLGQQLPRPKAVMVVSAHWLTVGTFVTCMESPRTIHDFGGFPEELYRLRYPSPGSPVTARRIAESVRTPPVICNLDWGLDHASWAILKHIYPRADIPVIELSLDYSPYDGWNQRSLQYHYDLAKQFGHLRDEDILIIGSGNVVHNLRMADTDTDAEPYDWAVEFDERVKRHLVNRNHHDLLDSGDISHATSLSVPTLDHYLPMIFAVAMQGKEDPLTFIYEGFRIAPFPCGVSASADTPITVNPAG